MLTLFIDESGCPGALRALNSQVQPLLVIASIALDTSHIAEVTRKYCVWLRGRWPGARQPAPAR
jgi:hypothetical protein